MESMCKAKDGECFKGDRSGEEIARTDYDAPSTWAHLAYEGERGWHGLFSESEDPQHPPLRHPGGGAVERVEPALHALCVYAPARLHGNVLHAIHRVRTRDRRHPRVGAKFPQHLAVFGIKGPEISVIRATRKHYPASRSQHRPPVLILIIVGPYFLSSLQVP